MALIYAIQVLERNPTTDKESIKFTKILPRIPVIDSGYIPEDRAELEMYVNNLVGIPWHDRDAILAGIYFTLNIQFPTNFYRIELIEWQK
jgi:hypothetical protein